jgi:TetR/AcrR family transcriptional regulator, transcriptional repressor for nem operon
MARPLQFDRTDALERATHVFWERGYEATSIDDLTQAIGIGRASLYHSFHDKRSLLTEVVTHYQANARSTLLDFLAMRGTGRAIIESLLCAFATPKSEGPEGCLCLNLGLELGEQDGELRAQILQGIQRLTDTFEALIRRGQVDGSLSKSIDATAAAHALSGATISLNAFKRMRAESQVLKNIVRVHMSLLPAP